MIFKDHLIAQIDIQFSNSMVESFFNKLKNTHLYFKNLDSLERVTKEVDYFVYEHNNVTPLRVLQGATPYEVFIGSWDVNRQLE